MADRTRNIGYPEPVAYDIPYTSPPPANNPVFRGLPLHYGAQIVSSIGLIPQFLWANAGFSRLRDRTELKFIEPRYDPTVIRVNEEQTTEIKDSELLSEDFSSRKAKSDVFPSILDYHEAYKSGRITPTAVAKALLPLIRRDVTTQSSHSLAFLQTRVDLVMKAAEASTERYKQGRPLSPIDGVPVAVKESIDVTGYKKTGGSLLDFTDERDTTSFCVQRWQDAGAVLVGKTNMHELGMDTTGNNPTVGTPLNPYNQSYYTGGSSSGSACAVATGLMPVAHGTDGGGSVRIPSSFCGLYGLKTTHGRVSKYPMTVNEKSTCVEGPIAANMVDVEISYRIMAQPDPRDLQSRHFASPQPCLASRSHSTTPKVLGICKPWFDRAGPHVQKSCWKLLDYFTSQLGYETIDIDLPMLQEGQLAHAITILAEAATAIQSVKKLSPANKVLISVGKCSTAVDLLQAQKVRNLVMQHLAFLFQQHPGLIIVTPTTPEAGWCIEAGAADLKYGCSDANKSVRSMEYVWMANFTGVPAITVPVGYAEPVAGNGPVPVGLMGMAEWCSEPDLIAFGYEAERWLNTASGAGRPKPCTFVDVMELASKGSK
ncbi:amidase signature enzyme [Polychaeton citri CBS 116435]|uniref:Amidase signature enzyme n=1 Tax=Polychaeton citri CBS 116435 TaxID=1314669 RepID=A0A9P4Q1B4_9PEZI|nr:amidase signature enzyme [Polychaeton citri CBS 116435]